MNTERMVKTNIGPRIKWLEHGDGLKLEKSTTGAAGYDIQAANYHDIVIGPGERKLIPTGITIAIPRCFEGQIRSRSGLAGNKGIIVLNSPGTIDSDYRGEVKVILYNTNPSGAENNFVVQRGDRIAQFVFAPVMCAEVMGFDPLFHSCEVEVVDELPNNNSNREGGFGSTGISS